MDPFKQYVAESKCSRALFLALRPPTDIVYTEWSSNSFRGYTIPVGGDVERPLALSISDLRAMPQQTYTSAK